MSQLTLRQHFPYTMKPVDNKSLENPSTLNKKNKRNENMNTMIQDNKPTTSQ
jgi:hypothetical protein